MKTTKRLNIEDKPGYHLTDMTNINNFNPKLMLINEFTIFKNGSIMFDISYFEIFSAHVVFNNIKCVF